FSGDADFREAQFSGYAYFREAQFSDYAYFREAQFSGGAYFREAQFSGHAYFSEAQFSGYAYFSEAQFSGDADFREAQFSGYAYFSEAQFSGDADFREAQFSGDADFREVQFSGDADFSKAKCGTGAYYDLAKFKKNAKFTAAGFGGICSFMDASFKSVPNFNFASFVQPPHIDGMSVKDKKDKVEEGLVERYRKIKEMAIQSKDFENELKYFGLEMQSKAYLPTTSRSKKYFILAYQALSDFGKSLARPIIALIAFLIAMSVINGSYMLLANDISKECREHKTKFIGTVVQYTFSEASPLFKLEPRRAIEIETCLFKQKALDIRNSLWRIIHLLPTTLLLFLFGLAVRNKFKIR
ncbi:MAG: hypothetical protein ACI8RW_000152, partial [Porticoccaceae bacterium]